MRHRVKGRKLSRKTAHRRQTLRDLSNALIREHRIVTTLAKAKALRPYFEPLVTRAKDDTQHNRRHVFSKLNNKHTVTKLFDEIGPKAADRPGGYTRIIRYGYRKGDGAEMAIIELVDYNDIKPAQEQKKQKKTRRAGRKKKTTSAQSQQEDTTQSEESTEETETADDASKSESEAEAETEEAETKTTTEESEAEKKEEDSEVTAEAESETEEEPETEEGSAESEEEPEAEEDSSTEDEDDSEKKGNN